MNFLAHLVLAPQTPEGWVGAIMPDLVRGPLPKRLPPAVRDAAYEHQRIDRFTDAHAAFVQTRDRLRACTHPRLAGVLADVLYDHVLARDWSRWQGQTLDTYLQRVEGALAQQQPQMPADMRTAVGLMLKQGWLGSYASAEGIRDRLAQMSARLKRRLGRPDMDLVISRHDLQRHYPAIADDFAVLWPALKAFTQQHRSASATRLAC